MYNRYQQMQRLGMMYPGLPPGITNIQKLSVACPTVTVVTPANITASSISLSAPSILLGSSLTVSIIWTNTGGAAGSFAPNISVDGTPQTALPTETIGPGLSVTHTFTVTGLVVGTHTICPIPN